MFGKPNILIAYYRKKLLNRPFVFRMQSKSLERFWLRCPGALDAPARAYGSSGAYTATACAGRSEGT